MTMGRRPEFVDDNISAALGGDLQNRHRRSRRRAWRHGLAAQTVLESVEDVRSYRTFERAFVSGFLPRSVVELELVYSLANLLWRLRRARTIETGLLDIQGEFLALEEPSDVPNKAVPPAIRPRANGIEKAHDSNGRHHPGISEEKMCSRGSQRERSTSAHRMAQCFMRLCALGSLLDRAGAYENRLWRQTAQTIWILDAIRRPPVAPARPRFRKPLTHHSWDPCR
jgi:hypothetical protein